ncbi:tobamovirus multiplication protein 1-like isoform X2 [Punica granatum]|uniref:Tobamovirus multiplication protein 1-like isoform X2 n=1 Tax=Punica granatum TaxID=22663 RepID=A0A6P8DS10_PUNGR|nr:tobamovirus multiplication protein 1-like isoform X2 [Punica granatum]
MFELRDGCCFPRVLMGVNVGLACLDFVIAVCAFYQLLRIQSRSPQVGWNRQKVFHLMIGSSSIGYFIYFVSTLVATCKGWLCWSHSCGFVLMAFPKILLFAAFLLLLSFWVDLCHQAKDDYEDEDGSFYESLLDRTMSNPSNSRGDTLWRCLPLQLSHVGRRQKIVILVTVLVSILMITAALLIWIGIGKNPIDSELVARVYVALSAIAMLFLGGALACYGLLLCSKMRKIRSERVASEMWKVGGLAVVSVLCFTTSSLIGLLTDIPLLYHWHPQFVNGLYVSILVILYYFIGSSVPSAFVLWVMRDLPPGQVAHKPEESGRIAFMRESIESVNVNQPQCWTATVATSTRPGNQITRQSPI